VARFLTEEWIDQFNAALDGVVLPLPGPDAGLAAAKGSFVVVEEIHDAPDGDLSVTLTAESGRLRLSRRAGGGRDDVDRDDRHDEQADVTIVLAYHDAVALSAGELTPAEAVGSGRIRVRGDLSVLASAHSMLDAAREVTAGLSATTTY
jgi:putative sterol carrier protein